MKLVPNQLAEEAVATAAVAAVVEAVAVVIAAAEDATNSDAHGRIRIDSGREHTP